MKKLFSILYVCLSLASCMPGREAYLRKKDIEAKRAHPQTFQPLVISGPFELKEGASLTVSAPTQPFQHTPIPDGQAIWAEATKDIVKTGALAGVAAYGIHEAAAESTTNVITESVESGE